MSKQKNLSILTQPILLTSSLSYFKFIANKLQVTSISNLLGKQIGIIKGLRNKVKTAKFTPVPYKRIWPKRTST